MPTDINVNYICQQEVADLRYNKNGYFMSTCKQSVSGFFLFAKEFMLHPLQVGSACPSSDRLAEVIANQVSLPIKGKVIELGAGTGVITKALLNRGIKESELILFERSEALAKYLKIQFPKINVIQDDAIYLQKNILENQNEIHAIVSSLPFRSLPHETANQIQKQIEAVLPEGGYFIQYTYDLRKNKKLQFKNLQHLYSKTVWLNFPPARVDVYQAFAK